MTPEEFARRILYHDNHLLVVDKPAGWLVQGDQTGDPTILSAGKAWLKVEYNKPGRVFLAPAHRLDRPVSGVLVLARTSKAASRLAEAFRTNQVKKKYIAVLLSAPKPASGEINSWLLKDERSNMVRSMNEPVKGAREAKTRYQIVEKFQSSGCMAELEPVTGRSHQLRVHMSSLGCPIRGDLRYGAPEGLGDFIMLHCHSLVVPHPTRREPMVFRAPLPGRWRLSDP